MKLPERGTPTRSTEEFYGYLPAGWSERRLRFLSHIIPSNVDKHSRDEELPIQLCNYTDVYYNDRITHDLQFMEATATPEQIARFGLQAGDTIITKDSETADDIGIPAFVPDSLPDVVCGYHLTILRPGSDIEGRFIHWLFQSAPMRARLETLATGLTRVGLSQQALKDLVVPLPNLEEQRHIAAFLDHETARIDELVREQEQLQALLFEKRQAEILRFITKGNDPSVKLKDSGVEWLGRIPEHWRVARVKHLSPVQRGASPRPIDDPIYFDDQGEYAWVRIADVSKAGKHLLETTQQLSALGSSLSVKLEPGNLFLSIAGTVGKPCITRIRACIHDGFVYFPRLRINPEFLYYVFEAGQAYLGLGKMGTQLNLNTETVGNIEIGLPPADEIEKILLAVRHATQKLDLLLEANQESIDHLLERRSTLISAAVTGQLDLQNWRPHESEAVAEVA